MKRFILLLLATLMILSLSSNIFAANDNAFYVNNAYFKGDGKYDVVVHGSSKDNLRLYVNDKNPIKAKVNKDGWATFRKVKLSGQSKLSFDRKVKLFKYAPVNYVKYIQVDGEQVKLSDTGPKHTYDEFYSWFRTEHKDFFIKYNNLPHLYSGTNYQIIMSACNDIDRNFGSLWVKCMQEGYKDYLKPDTFVNNNWTGDYSTMVGNMNYAGPKDDQYEKQMKEAKKLYEKLAVTN